MREENALLQAFIIVAKRYKKELTLQVLTQEMALDSKLSLNEIFSQKNQGLEDIFSRVTENVGFKSKLVSNIKLKKISKILFPVILLLKEENVCILTQVNKERSHAKIIFPQISGEEPYWIELKELESEFVGSFFLVKERLQEHHKVENKEKKKHWFWNSLAYSKGLYFDVLLASFLLNLFMLATPLFTMNVYDRVVPNGAFDTLWVFTIAIAIVYIFDTIIKLLRTYTLEVVAKKSDVLIASRIFEQVLKIKLSHRFSSVGSFASHLREFETIRSFFSSASMSTIIDLPFFFLFLWVIFIIGGSLVFVPLLSAFLIIVYAFIIKYPLQKSIKSVAHASAHKNTILIESLSSIESIKSFSLQNRIQWKWEESVGNIAKEEIRLRLLSNSISTVSNFVVQLSTVAVLVLGVYAIEEQSLSMGGLIALVMLTSRALAPLNQFASLISNYEQSKNSYKQLDNIMNLPTDHKENQRFIERKSINGTIEFKKVTFKYPNAKQYILENVSFKILPHEKVGIIGTNGSGKTTILKLIMGLYEPQSGVILIDGVDIRQLNPYSLQKYIAYVPQEILLFKGTLQENLRDTVESLCDEALIEACQKSAVENFVANSELGYNMQIKERGEGLSGGERQAIGVARAFIKKEANILLLDEPTNAMDSTNEALVEKNIKAFAQKKTLLLITHKQSLLKMTKRLILLKDGKILLDDSQENVLKALGIKVKNELRK
jgi:ATP-binding cassette subfamily C protein LapB